MKSEKRNWFEKLEKKPLKACDFVALIKWDKNEICSLHVAANTMEHVGKFAPRQVQKVFGGAVAYLEIPVLVQSLKSSNVELG